MNAKTNKKEQIIKASAKIFANKGKAGARMKDIAKEAEVSSALLHYHYKSKDDLYFEVLKYYLGYKLKELKINNDYIEKLLGNGLTPELKGKISEIIKTYDKFFKTHKYFTKLLIQEVSNDAITLRQIIDDIRQENEEELKFKKKLFQKLNNEKINSNKIFHTFVTILVLILSQYTFNSFFDIILENNNIDKKKFYEERIDHIIEQIWKIIHN